jgi:hypothetical protein
MKLLGGHVAVAAVEQKARQGEALTRRSKARAAQTVDCSSSWALIWPAARRK